MSTGKPASAAEPETMSPADLVALARERPLEAAERIMALLRSPAGCPWDREQSFDSIRRHTLEEAYEVFDAIERRAWPELKDELGDLLLQVLFYAQMAAEQELFDFADVARSLNAKLIRRHPHIFADVSVSGSAEVKRNWDEIKRAERQSRSETAQDSLLIGVPRALPALMEAGKLGSEAAKIGFDWSEPAGVLAKVREELDELECELRTHADGTGTASTTAVEDELGDVLFSMVSLARHLHLDPEMALRGANAKFRRRFSAMEEIARDTATPIENRSAADLEALWTTSKQRLGKQLSPEDRAR